MYLRLLQRGTAAVFILVLAVWAGLRVYSIRSVDSTPPVITCDSDVVEIRVGADESALLKGVTAYDDRDGDLTDEIIIKGVSQLITADTAKVTYIAFDSSNNMTTTSRTVHYTNYEKPRFALTQPLVFLMGSQVRLMERLTASDVIDGDLSNSIRVTTQNVDTSRAGIYSVTVQVINSLGDVESLPLKVIISDSSVINPRVKLSDYIVYLEAGSRFDPHSYITAPAERYSVDIDSGVETAQPGVYEVTYTYQGDTAYQVVVVR